MAGYGQGAAGPSGQTDHMTAIQTLPQAPGSQSIALKYLRKHPLPNAFKALYAIEDELGAGGCGFCMSAIRHADGKEVCAKFILKSRVSSQSWVRDDTYWAAGPTVNPGSNGGMHGDVPHTSNIVPLEVYLLRRIKHQGIVAYYDCFEDIRFFILVMELHGTSWERKLELPSFSILTDSLVTSVKSRDAHIFVDDESDDEEGDDDNDSDSDDIEEDESGASGSEDVDENIDLMDVSGTLSASDLAGQLRALTSASHSASLLNTGSGANGAAPGGTQRDTKMAQSRSCKSAPSNVSSEFGQANTLTASQAVAAAAAQAAMAADEDNGTKKVPLTPPPTPPVHNMESSGDPAMTPSSSSVASTTGANGLGRPAGPGRFFPSLHGTNGATLPPSSASSQPPIQPSQQSSAAPPSVSTQHQQVVAGQQHAAYDPDSSRSSLPPPPQPPRPAPSSLPPAPVTGVRKRASCDLFEAIEKLQYFTEAQARHIFRQIAEAVFYLHARCGIVHRDIKDENVVMDSQLTVKLIDLGNASFIPTTTDGYFDRYYGTLQYCPPEILLGARYRGPEAEMWSLGILLYTICCGELPFADAQQAIHLRYATPRYSRTPECVDLMDRLLDKDPSRRASIEDVLRHRWFAIAL